jgi:carbamoyltransferase
LRRILTEWVSGTSKPVLLALIPLESSIDGLSDPSNYQKRFREFAADTGCRVHDLLSDLRALPKNERLTLWSYKSGHLSAIGHRAIARVLGPVIRRTLEETLSKEPQVLETAAALP